MALHFNEQSRDHGTHTATEVGSISAVENLKKTCRKNDTIDVAAVKATNTILTSQDLNSLRSVQAEQPGRRTKHSVEDEDKKRQTAAEQVQTQRRETPLDEKAWDNDRVAAGREDAQRDGISARHHSRVKRQTSLHVCDLEYN
jgi:hypothetical protein